MVKRCQTSDAFESTMSELWGDLDISHLDGSCIAAHALTPLPTSRNSIAKAADGKRMASTGGNSRGSRLRLMPVTSLQTFAVH